jgi:RimJ/RimL family protein N-acetyltransferase
VEHPGVLVDHFPLVGLRLTTGRLELRLPDAEELGVLADVAAEGVHDPEYMPFPDRWTEDPDSRGRTMVLRHWRWLGQWTPRSWRLPLAVFHEVVPVGVQTLEAESLAVTGECGTAGWLGRRHQGRGIGTEMRTAVAHLAFAHLGAQEMLSRAYADNAASLAVSAKLGYVDDGTDRFDAQGTLRLVRRLRLTRDTWHARPRPAVTVTGLTPCLPLFGLPPRP